MSHFTTIRTQFTDRDDLVLALNDMGFSDVEVHDQPQPLYGFEGKLRPESAEVIVRKKYVGSASNDLGFRKTSQGSYEAIVSSYDRSRYGGKWMDRLTQRYAYRVATAKLEQQGFTLVTEESEGERIRLVLRRAV